MIDYKFYRTVYGFVEADLTPKRQKLLREWLDLCEQHQWHPLEYSPARFREAGVTVDKDMTLALWKLLNFIRDNIYECPELQQRWMVLFNMRYTPGWEPEEDELMSLEDIHPTLPPHLQEQPPFSPPPPVPGDFPVKPIDPPWKMRKAGHTVHHRPFARECDCGGDAEEHSDALYGLIDDMTYTYWDRERIQDIAFIGQDFADWAVANNGDPLHIDPDSAAAYLEAHPCSDRPFVWDSMFFILQYLLTNSKNPDAYVSLWEGYQRTSLKVYEERWQQELDAMRDAAIIALGELGWSSNKIARLRYKDLAGQGGLPAELLHYITKLTAPYPPKSTDRVFSLTPGAVMKILVR